MGGVGEGCKGFANKSSGRNQTGLRTTVTDLMTVRMKYWSVLIRWLEFSVRRINDIRGSCILNCARGRRCRVGCVLQVFIHTTTLISRGATRALPGVSSAHYVRPDRPATRWPAPSFPSTAPGTVHRLTDRYYWLPVLYGTPTQTSVSCRLNALT